MNLLEYINSRITFLDGGMGTMLQKRIPGTTELPERLNISHPEVITDIQREYFNAGSNIVSANTFGANCYKYPDEAELETLIKAAIDNARAARDSSNSDHEKFIALDIGPLGKLLKPYGDLDFEDAVKAYGKTVKIGASYGVDLVFIETMNDSLDTKAALLAAKENCDLPVFVSNSYSEGGRLMTGASPLVMISMLEAMGADAIGVNCSMGPEGLKDVAAEYLKYASVPVLLKPNAGLPTVVGDETIYNVHPEEFSDSLAEYAKEGIRLMGGCCGTTPDHIRAVTAKAKALAPVPLSEKNDTVISSYTHAVRFGEEPVIISIPLDPYEDTEYAEALEVGETDYLVDEAFDAADDGAEVLNVNVSYEGTDEAELLDSAVYELQTVIDLPLQLDSTDPEALKRALRHCNGKAMVNLSGDYLSKLDEIFDVVKKYGAVVSFETPCEELYACAEKHGIKKKDLFLLKRP